MIIILLTVYVIHWKIHGNPNLSSVKGVKGPRQCICVSGSLHRTQQYAWWLPLEKGWHRYRSVPEVLSHLLFLIFHANSHFKCLAPNASSLTARQWVWIHCPSPPHICVVLLCTVAIPSARMSSSGGPALYVGADSLSPGEEISSASS